MDIDEREDQDGLNHLVSLQYWNQGFELASEGSMNTNLLQNPCQMSDALGRIFYSEAERRQLKTVTEADITREVLSLLRGYGGILFEYKEGRFILDENYVVQHVSQHALMSLLGEFCLYGNILSELRQKVASKANDTQYGQTSQAFAETIFKSLMDFDGSLSQLELSASFISRDPTQAISILNLRNTLDPSLQCFKAINDIALDIPFAEANPRLITTYLIATLFDRTLIAQSSGQMLIYDTLLYTLEQTLVPYGRIMDDWIYYGLLTGDKAGEFYVSRRDSVSLSDPNFWIDGFSIQPVIHPISTRFPCPLFDDALMARMLFTGKAVNLLSQIEKTRKQLPQPDQTYIPFGTVISRFLAVKPPFIKFTGKITQPLHSSPPAYDLFTSACIPLATEAKTDVEQTATSTYDFGSLFDQNFFRCSEAYIEEPYKKTADKLNNTLHRDCGLSRQLESLAAIYLMLENDLMHSFCEALFIHIDNNEPWFDQRVLNQTFTEACETSGYNEAVYIQVRQRRGDNTSSPTTIAKYLEDIEVKMEVDTTLYTLWYPTNTLYFILPDSLATE
jgi:gamma-tubulin complex component 5